MQTLYVLIHQDGTLKSIHHSFEEASKAQGEWNSWPNTSTEDKVEMKMGSISISDKITKVYFCSNPVSYPSINYPGLTTAMKQAIKLCYQRMEMREEIKEHQIPQS